MLILTSLILFFLPITFYKSNLMKLFLVIYAYPIFIIFIMCFNYDVGRIIKQIGLNYYNKQDMITSIIPLVISYIFILIISLSYRKTIFSLKTISLGIPVRCILFFLFLLISFIAYPKAMGISDTIRYNLIFGSWGCVFNVLSIFILFSKSKKYDVINILTYTILIICFLSGERADTIITIILLFLLKKDSNGNITERKINIIKLFLILISFSILASIIGAARSNIQIQDISLFITKSLLSVGTVVDVIHVYLSSIWYVEHNGNSFTPLFNIIKSFIPLAGGGGVSSEENITWFLNNYIHNVGGGLFYSPFYIAFSSYGVILFNIIYFLFFTFTFKNKNSYIKYIFIVFYIMQCRIQWYGITYFFTSFKLTLLFLIIIYFLKKLPKKLSNEKNIIHK